jgi:pectate lyase
MERRLFLLAGILIAGGIVWRTCNPVWAAELPAFPGAEGFGSTTVGGRGGRVIYVTNVDDSGAGSFRAALEASGPRTVVFQVRGTVRLKSNIKIENPNITIAGQTAPGDGIQIRDASIFIFTNDVVIRYLKLRIGDDVSQSSSSPDTRAGINIGKASGSVRYRNIIIDHSELIWGSDQGGLEILPTADYVTIQWSILGEGLYHSNHSEARPPNFHSMNTNFPRNKNELFNYAKYVTLHHNLLTNSKGRNPQIRLSQNVDFVNNLVYNFGHTPVSGNPRSLNLINNYFLKGPESASGIEYIYQPDGTTDTPIYNNAVYESGNIAPGIAYIRRPPLDAYRSTRNEPFSLPKIDSAEEAYQRILDKVGPRLPVADENTKRIIYELLDGNANYLNGVDYHGISGRAAIRWPNLNPGTAPVDRDDDGIPDNWELANFGNLNQGSATDSGSDFDEDGYTDLEEYLNNTDPVLPEGESQWKRLLVNWLGAIGDQDGDGKVNSWDWVSVVSNLR